MAKKQAAKRPVGRPFKKLDERQIRELSKIQCTHKEIAAVMGCDEDTVRNNYSAIINEAREEGKSSLRRAQWKKAVEEGNHSMLIWLGKHYLGQHEELKLSSSNEPEVRKLVNMWDKMNKNDKNTKEKVGKYAANTRKKSTSTNRSKCKLCFIRS